MLIQRMKMTKTQNTLISYLALFGAALMMTSLSAQPTFAADDGIYKSIGENGSIVFTDKPKGNSVSVTSRKLIPVTNSQPILDVGPRADEYSSDTLGGRDKSKINVRAVTIISPEHNQTISTTESSMLFTIALGPDKRLPEGYTTEIKMNGVVVSNQDSTQITVPVPNRGTHLFEARVVSSNGIELVGSEPIRVHVNTN